MACEPKKPIRRAYFVAGKRYTVQYVRIVFEYLQRVDDKDVPLRPLIYPEDKCGTIKRIPRFIPEPVFKQLQDNLHLLMPHIRNAVVIIMNVGMRASTANLEGRLYIL